MRKWRLTYVINDGSTMFGLEPAREHVHEAELDTAGLGEEDTLKRLHAAIHNHTDGLGVLVGADDITS